VRKILIGTIVATCAVVSAAAIANWPDIKRYLRIRRM
jgi:hypothetical protein